MERKKIMMWMLMWLNVSAAVLNATFQLLVIYRLEKKKKKSGRSINPMFRWRNILATSPLFPSPFVPNIT